MTRSLLAAFFVILLGVIGAASPAASQCPQRPPWTGCGCKGGPGYRGPDGRCVSHANLTKVCGARPEERCVFENAPGTGANRECVLAPKNKKK